MKANKVDFDEARYLFCREKMTREGIDPDSGLPLDPKAIVCV